MQPETTDSKWHPGWAGPRDFPSWKGKGLCTCSERVSLSLAPCLERTLKKTQPGPRRARKCQGLAPWSRGSPLRVPPFHPPGEKQSGPPLRGHVLACTCVPCPPGVAKREQLGWVGRRRRRLTYSVRLGAEVVESEGAEDEARQEGRRALALHARRRQRRRGGGGKWRRPPSPSATGAWKGREGAL